MPSDGYDRGTLRSRFVRLVDWVLLTARNAPWQTFVGSWLVAAVGSYLQLHQSLVPVPAAVWSAVVFGSLLLMITPLIVTQQIFRWTAGPAFIAVSLSFALSPHLPATTPVVHLGKLLFGAALLAAAVNTVLAVVLFAIRSWEAGGLRAGYRHMRQEADDVY